MKVKLAVIIGLILAFSEVTALDFHESINTNGEGTLYSKTNDGRSQDLAEGVGDIEYVRSISTDNEVSILSSKYTLTNGKFASYKNYGSFRTEGLSNSGWIPYMPGYSPNRYIVSMNLPGQVSHVLSVYGTTDISSDSNVNFFNEQITTDYNINASGSLEERVLDGSGGKRQRHVAETWLSGNGFSLSSGLNYRNPFGSDRSILVGILNETNMMGEKSVQEPPTSLEGVSADIVIGVPETDAPESDGQTLNVDGTNEGTESKCDLATGSGCDRGLSLKSDPEKLKVQSTESAIFAVGNATKPNDWVVVTEDTRRILVNTRCNDPGVVCEEFTHIAARRPGIGERYGGLGQLQGVSPTTTIIGVIKKPI
jgi:hypothetical protein